MEEIAGENNISVLIGFLFQNLEKCAIRKPLWKDEKCFLLHLKSSYRSQDI